MRWVLLLPLLPPLLPLLPQPPPLPPPLPLLLGATCPAQHCSCTNGH
jgi:hypothetical protein